MSDAEAMMEQTDSADPVVEEGTEEEKLMAKLKEAISVKKEEVGPLRLKMTVTVPRDTLDERLGEQFDELKRDATVPGFRKGHAPLRLVEKRFGSDVGDQLKTQLVSSGYLAAVEKEDIKTLGDPLLWVSVKEERVDKDKGTHTVTSDKLLPIDKALDHLEFPKEGPLTFSCEVELQPEFKLPELKGIPVKQPTITVSDDDVEAELSRIRSVHGTFESIEKGPVKLNDMLYVDMKMSVDDQQITTEKNSTLWARDTVVQNIPIDGLGKVLTGKNVDQTASIEADVPDDSDNVEIRGKKATFEFTIREIKRFVLAPMDKKFLTSIGFDNEKDLRSAVKDGLESRLSETLRTAQHEQIGLYLLDKTDMEIPEGLSQRQLERSLERRKVELYQSGMVEAEVAKKVDEMRSKAKSQVVDDLKLFFILEKIAEEREVDISEEQLNGAIAAIAQRTNKRFDRVRDELSKRNGMTTLYMRLRDDAVMDLLLTDADVAEVESPKTKKTATKAVKKTTSKTKTPDKKESDKPTAEQQPAVKKTAKKTTAKKKTPKK